MWKVDRLVDRVGEWNAQLFRELKGRATLKNILLATVLSVGGQIMLLLTFLLQLPTNPSPESERSSQIYCVLESIPVYSNSRALHERSVCQLNALGQVITDWPHWWADILAALSWAIPLLLMTGGVYLLANDLRQESRRGTLNFLRLSPQSASEILVGKLLGVPVLVYCAVMIALPLHLGAVVGSGFGLVNTVAWYIFMLALAGVFYTAAILLTLASPMVPIALAVLTLGMANSLLSMTHWLVRGIDAIKPFNADMYWFYLPINHSRLTFYLFGIGNCLVIIYWLWQSIGRCYRDPSSTLLAKKSSYQLNLCWQIWLVGFSLPLGSGSYAPFSAANLALLLGGILIFQIWAAFVAIFLLTPQRQAITDWSRYRRDRHRPQLWQRDIWQDLLWDDRSPASLALAVNLAIALIIWLPWCPFAFADGQMAVKAGISVVVTAVLLWNYGLLIQMWLITNKKWPWQQAIAYITPLVVLPASGAMFAAIMGLPSIASFILATASPLAIFGIYQITWGELLLGAAIQSLVAVMTITRLQRHLYQMGQSETQALFSAV
jgi:hypothetical protein